MAHHEGFANEYEIDDLVDAIVQRRQPSATVAPHVESAPPAPAAYAAPVAHAAPAAPPTPAPPRSDSAYHRAAAERIEMPAMFAGPRGSNGSHASAGGNGSSGLKALEGGDALDVDELVDAIVTAPRKPEPPLKDGRIAGPTPRSNSHAPPPQAPPVPRSSSGSGPVTSPGRPPLPSSAPGARPLSPTPPLPTPGPRSSSQSAPLQNTAPPAAADDGPRMWSEATPPPRSPPPRTSSRSGGGWSENTPPPSSAIVTGTVEASRSATTADMRPMPTADVPRSSPTGLPSFDPPRMPPNRSVTAPGGKPRPHSTADLEANTPVGPIDTIRMEQPTRPPMVGGTTTQPGSKSGESGHDLQPGHLIGERYRVLDAIGRGGVSVVYRVEHTLLLKRMALKVLRPELSETQSVVDRFQREARLVCQLDDPHIVRVTDFGRMPEGALFLVMDYVEGESLATKLRREGKLAPEAATRIVLEILTGLAHAHEHGIIHRDLKPENIMVNEKNYRMNTKILDFGIAKLGDGDEGTRPITQAGTVFGTPRYMSPEQAAGEPVDKRTDIYTTGVILYELLTGRPPFDGETTVRILSKVLTQNPPPMHLGDARPYEAAALEGIVMAALSKEKTERFPTVQEFKRVLETCDRV